MQTPTRLTHRVLFTVLALILATTGFLAAGNWTPAPGPAGNIEFLIRLTRAPALPLDLAQATDQVLARAASLKRQD